MIVRLMLFCCLCTAAVSASATSIDESVAALDGIELGGAPVDAAGKSYEFGNLSLAFESGTLQRVVADGETVGLFFDGGGSFRYESIDPLEAANFRTNVKRATRYAVAEGGISGALEAALIWDAAPAAKLVPGEGEPSAETLQRFAKFRTRFGSDRSSQPEVRLAHALAEGTAGSLAMAQLQGAKHDLFWVHDRFRDQQESLVALQKMDTTSIEALKRFRYHETLSEQPIGRSRLDLPPVPFRLVDVDLELTNPAGRSLELTTRQTFEIDAPLRVLDLDLLSYRFYVSEYPYELVSVKLGDRELAHVHRWNRLLVELPEPTKPGAKLKLEFRLRGDVLYRPNDDNYWELGTSPWLPLPRRFDMQFFRYHAVVKVPEPFLPFSNGRTVRRWKEESTGLVCAEFEETHPIWFPVVLAGKYQLYEQSHEGVTIQVASYASKKTARMKEIANNLFALMELYGRLLGDYPYTELKVLEINQWGFGQAPPGIIFITKDAFLTGSRVRGWSQGLNARIAHELAHTWWGDITPWAADHDQWLSESTADYFAAVAMGLLWRQSKMDDIVREWIQNSRTVKDGASILLANQLAGEGAWRDRYGLLYNKGPLVLHALRQRLGDDKFFSVFRSLLTNFRFRHVQTKDFIKMVQFVTGEDHGEWLRDHLAGTAWPDAKALKSKRKGR